MQNLLHTLKELTTHHNPNIKRHSTGLIKALNHATDQIEEATDNYNQTKCNHDWDNYGKCCNCKVWNINNN